LFVPEQTVVKQTFDQVYKDTFAFVWRITKKQGVHESQIDDIVQEIFLTVHRRLPSFEWKCGVKTWVYSITMNVITNYRRTRKRKGSGQSITSDVGDPDLIVDDAKSPFENSKQAQASKILHHLISQMDQKKAEAFVLSELEGMSASEIAEALKVNTNTVFSRIRASRIEFQELLDKLEQ